MGEGEGGMFRETSIETCILSRVKQITSPGWMHETSAWGWCPGKTKRDGMEREGGSGWGINVGSFVGKFLCEIFELRGSVVLRFIINQPCVSRIWNIFH